MILRILKITNFRNLSGEYNFKKGLNLVIALNGAGKTNLLEALNFISDGKSFRTGNEISVIKHSLLDLDSMAFARLSAVLVDALGNEKVLEVYMEKVNNSNGVGYKKVLKTDGNNTTRSKFIKNFYTIIFSPNTLNLVTGSPSLRRRDLDDFLSVYDETYFEEIQEYKKVVRSRNKLLEKILENNGRREELDFWDKKIASLGAVIIYKRLKFFDKVEPMIEVFAPRVFNLQDTDLTFKYLSKFCSSGRLSDIEKSLHSKVCDNREKEIRAGVSLYGPQREDFLFFLNDKDLREYGSRGQQRLCAFLYKITQWKVLKEKLKHFPILLLDDLFSELDEKIHKKIQHFLQTLDTQLVLTSLGHNEMEDEFVKGAHLVSL